MGVVQPVQPPAFRESKDIWRAVDVVTLPYGDGRGPVEETVGLDPHSTWEHSVVWQARWLPSFLTAIIEQPGCQHGVRDVAGQF